MFTIASRFEDGFEETIEDSIPDLYEAIDLALDFADQAGQSKGNGHGPPKWVRVYRGRHLEIAITILPGGLISP